MFLAENENCDYLLFGLMATILLLILIAGITMLILKMLKKK